MSIATTTATAPIVESPAPPGPEADLDSLYEVVDGRRVEKPPMAYLEAVIAGKLDQRLGGHALANGLGRVVPEALFRINPPGGPLRRPNLAFVSYERWPRDRKLTLDEAWDVIPDLAVEVVSKSNSATAILLKVAEYFRSGVRRVWVVYPPIPQVHVFSSPKLAQILDLGDTLDGGDILPSLRLHLAELFEDVDYS